MFSRVNRETWKYKCDSCRYYKAHNMSALLLLVPRPQTNIGKRAFSVAAPLKWNTLPNYVRYRTTFAKVTAWTSSNQDWKPHCSQLLYLWLLGRNVTSPSASVPTQRIHYGALQILIVLYCIVLVLANKQTDRQTDRLSSVNLKRLDERPEQSADTVSASEQFHETHDSEESEETDAHERFAFLHRQTTTHPSSLTSAYL